MTTTQAQLVELEHLDHTSGHRANFELGFEYKSDPEDTIAIKDIYVNVGGAVISVNYLSEVGVAILEIKQRHISEQGNIVVIGYYKLYFTYRVF